jgi:MFS family permease
LHEAPAAIQDAADAAISPRRIREFRLLLTGSSVSMLGSRVSTIAYPLLVLALTDSPVAAGWACFAATAPSVLFYLPAGALVDRWNPRRAMLTCESLRGLAIASVVLLLALGRLSVTLLILVAVVEEILEVFSNLAERRVARSLVEPSDAASALAQSEARTHMVVMLGRPIGAVLFSADRFLPFLADAVTFVVSIATVLPIRNQRSGYSEPTATPHLRREIGEGLGWLHTHPFARHALWRTAGTTFIFQALVIIFLGKAYGQHLHPAVIGIVLAASGLGGVLGSTMTSWLFAKFGYSLFRKQLSIWILTFAVLALSGGGRSVTFLAISMTVLGFTGALGNIALDTYIVQNAEETILARVLSVGRLISFTALALGPLLGGFLIKEYGAQAGLVVLLIAAVLLRIAAPAAPQHDPRTQGRHLRHSRAARLSLQETSGWLTSRRGPAQTTAEAAAAACPPARRPEKTQSASESPLT